MSEITKLKEEIQGLKYHIGFLREEIQKLERRCENFKHIETICDMSLNGHYITPALLKEMKQYCKEVENEH